MSVINDLLNDLDEFNESPESFAIDFRLSVTQAIMSALKEKGWTQKSLAEKANVKQSFLSRVLHGDENWTSETIARLFCALGIRPSVVAADSVKTADSASNVTRVMCVIFGPQYGKEKYKPGTSTANQKISAFTAH